MFLDTAAEIASVCAAVPKVSGPSIRIEAGGQSGYFVCTLGGFMRSVPWWRKQGPHDPVLSDAQIAQHIAKELNS